MLVYLYTPRIGRNKNCPWKNITDEKKPKGLPIYLDSDNNQYLINNPEADHIAEMKGLQASELIS